MLGAPEYATFCAICDEIKAKSEKTLTNIFIDSNKLRDLAATRQCLWSHGGDAAILLAPMHSSFYELYFICGSYGGLEKCLARLESANIAMPVRATIAGKNEAVNNKLVECFRTSSFSLAKKMIRTRSKRPDDSIIAAMRTLADDFYKYVSFAKEGDAAEISAILKENFDVINDNIPEFGEIEENIRKNQVTVLRMDGKIASLHYFVIQNNILYGYFDVTRKEYRGSKSLFLAIAVFEHDYFKVRNMNVARAMGWRDVTNARLVRHAAKTSQQPDGVHVCNMVWRPGRVDGND